MENNVKTKQKVFLILKFYLMIPRSYFESVGLIHDSLTVFCELIQG